MSNPSVLVIEDDKAIRSLICTTLEINDYSYKSSPLGKQGILDAASFKPDILLLDLGLPDMDGVEVIRTVRTWSSAPIIVISARSDGADKIEALDAGADDYLTKPFSIDELLARLRSINRRLAYMRSLPDDWDSVFVNGALTIDYAAGYATLDGVELHLTPYEYRLLCLLAANVGKVLTHSYITREIWGAAWEGDVSSLRVFMASLRKKIEKKPSQPQYIQTHVGIGYRMLKL